MDTSQPTTGLVVFNMGGPDRLDDIEPFLRELLSDPAILPAPGFVRKPLARRIARKRAPMVAPHYEKIGGGSPLLSITRAQAEGIAQRLTAAGTPTRPWVVMRYTPPRAAAVAAEIAAAGLARLVVLSLYPHYTSATTGTSVSDLKQALAAAGVTTPTVWIESWYDDPGYVAALAATVEEAISEIPEEERHDVPVLFSAHGLPERNVRKGDPYVDHVQATMNGVVERLGLGHPLLSFQSRVGPVKWLEPATTDEIVRLGDAGHRNLAVVPISFVSDHLETLYELDIELRELAEEHGVTGFFRAPALNTRPDFLDALTALVQRRLAA